MNSKAPSFAATSARTSGNSAWQQRAAIAYPLLILLGMLIVLPANSGSALLHDSFAIYWVWADQFTAELAHGNLYPRWLPLSDGGLGAPVFYFYPPLAFHLSGIFGLLGFSTYGSIIAAFAAAFSASGIGCWHWLKGRTSQPLLGASFFACAPYHLLDYTLRGAIAESVAIALIPPLAIGLDRIRQVRGGRMLAAISYGAMICTHLPLALLVSLFMIAPQLLLSPRKLIGFATAALLGIGLSGIYLLPALALEPFHDVGQLYRTSNLRTDYWSIYAWNWSDPTYVVVMAVIIATVLAATLPVIRRRDGWASYAIITSLIAAGVVPFLWSFPLLAKVQFPYRVLPIAEFALATALARVGTRDFLEKAAFLFPVLLSMMIIPGFHMPQDSLARLESLHPDVYEYLPKGVMKPGQTQARLSDVLAPRRPPPRVPGLVVEQHFYFPSWSCGRPEPRTQLLMHEPSCVPRLLWTVPEKIGLMISIVSALLLTLLSLSWPRELLLGRRVARSAGSPVGSDK
jgi:hypothetical protein